MTEYYSAASQMIYYNICPSDHRDFDYNIDYTDDQLESFVSDMIEDRNIHPDEDILFDDEQPDQPEYYDEIVSINIFKNLEVDDPDEDPYEQISDMRFTCNCCDHYYIFHPDMYSKCRALQQEMREEDIREQKEYEEQFIYEDCDD